jgi:S-methylmethionine-dependent homocysteine/selenocysteine methylase
LNAHVNCEADSAAVNGPVIREAESAKSGKSAKQYCNCGEIWEKKKDKWKMKVLAEKKKVEWLKWLIIASWLIFAVFFVKK